MAERDKFHGGGSGEEHVVWENPTPFGEDCFKRNEEMAFDAMAAKEHEWCDEIKRNVPLKGDFSTYTMPGAFSWSDF